jgi:plastocyanin
MRQIARIAVAAASAATLVIGVGACSSGSSSSSSTPGYGASPTTSAPAAAGTITIKNFAFSGPLTVPAGATVAVTNDDTVEHTVTGDSPGQFDTPAPAGQTVTFMAPMTAGTYPYHCSIHPNMHGTLIVK